MKFVYFTIYQNFIVFNIFDNQFNKKKKKGVYRTNIYKKTNDEKKNCQKRAKTQI